MKRIVLLVVMITLFSCGSYAHSSCKHCKELEKMKLREDILKYGYDSYYNYECKYCNEPIKIKSKVFLQKHYILTTNGDYEKVGEIFLPSCGKPSCEEARKIFNFVGLAVCALSFILIFYLIIKA